MANFNLFLPELLKTEGGYQNKLSDRKGNTNSLGQMVGTKYGISAPVYEAYIKRPPTVADMKNLPLSTAVLIAKNTIGMHAMPMKSKINRWQISL